MGPRTRAKKKGEGMRVRPLSPIERLERKLDSARTPLERELLGTYKDSLKGVLEVQRDHYISHPTKLKDVRAFLKDSIKVALADPKDRKNVDLGVAPSQYRRSVEEFAREIDRVADSVELKTPRRAKKESFDAYQRRIDRFYNRPQNKRKRVFAAVRIMQRMAKAGQFGTAEKMVAAREKEKTARKKIVPVPTTVYTYHFYAAPAGEKRKIPLERYRQAKKFEIISSREIPHLWYAELGTLKGADFNKKLRDFGVTSVVNLRDPKDKNPRASLAVNIRNPLTTDSKLIEVARKTVKRPKRKRV